MIQHPVLKYCYRAEFLDNDRVLLLSENDNSLLTGKAYCLVLSEIQKNSRNTGQLAADLEHRISPFEIYYVLDALEKKGYITESASEAASGADSVLAKETCAFLNSRGMDVNTLQKVLEDKPVSLEVAGMIPDYAFIQAFKNTGIRTGQLCALKVIVTDDYERRELEAVNAHALETGTPWMAVKAAGTQIWIGPIFVPEKTGCWKCLEQRLEINRPVNTFYKAQKNTQDIPHVPAAYSPASLQIAANFTAQEIVKWLYFGKNESLEGKIVTIDTSTIETRPHILVKRPQCPACGLKPGRPEPVILKKKSAYCSSVLGGYREIPPEETLEKYQHHVSPVTGVVRSLTPYHSIEGAPLYNYSAGPNNAFRSTNMFWVNQHMRSTSGGKGKTWTQAKTGALCEGIERYSLTWHGDEHCIVSSLQKLGTEGIHPNTCMNFSKAQYENREENDPTGMAFYSLVPVPFDESLEMHWSPVYSLTQKMFKYLPSCFCYAQYPAQDDNHVFAYPDSNGCAAGNSMEEAVLQGFLELAERDSTALWWYNMLTKPGVDLESFDDPWFLQLIEYYKTLNRSLYVLDLTSDLNIPAFAAISHRPGREKENIIFGFGAHINAKIGIERALAEVNQILPVVNAPGIEKGKYLTRDKNFIDWLDSTSMKKHPYLMPDKNMEIKTASNYQPLCSPDIYHSVMYCINQAEKNGLETLVLDTTRPDVGLNAVKVIVPGLRHFWKRLAQGRLYDVPVKMGWMDAPLKEEKINSVGIFI